MEKTVSKRVPPKASKKMTSMFEGYGDDDSGYGDDGEDQVEALAQIFTLFAMGLVPSINKEVSLDLCREFFMTGGIGPHNATICGRMLQRTAFGVMSRAKH